MKITDEQQNCIDGYSKHTSILVRARAGTGKTALICETAKQYNNKKFQVIVFNKKNQEEMSGRLPSNASGSTCHSFCNKFVRGQIDSSGNKMFNIIYPLYNFKKDGLTSEESVAIKDDFFSMKDLVSLCKNYFITPKSENVIWLIDHYGFTFSQPLDKIADDCISFVKQSDMDDSKKDFDDMIRKAVLNNSIAPNFDSFIIDEAQDNTPVRSILLQQLSRKGVQVSAVGDDRQAIYGFAGADCNGLSNIIELISPTVYPLTINFRCGKKIIEYAQYIVPDIRAFGQSCDGSVKEISQKEFEEQILDGDVAISRYNKIIIPACFKLIKEGKKATIIGRDFGAMLIKMIKDFKASDIRDFYEKIEKWKDRQLKYCKSDSATDAVNDKFECLKFFADESDTPQNVISKIESIFSDSKEGIKFTTAHKSKGLEWKRVFILDYKNFKMNRDLKPWEAQQESNLEYVAITRAKEELFLVL